MLLLALIVNWHSYTSRAWLGYTTDISVNTFDICYLSIFSIGNTICTKLQHELRATPKPQLQQFAAIAQLVNCIQALPQHCQQWPCHCNKLCKNTRLQNDSLLVTFDLVTLTSERELGGGR